MIRLLQGDCRVTLPTLAATSVQACITSPPYWGLRDYGTPPLVWGGDADHAHEWQARRWYAAQGNATASAAAFSEAGPDNAARLKAARWHDDVNCRCGAWLGSLGLEPTPDLYVEHIVECLRHVRRVLREDSTLWLNLGDSYAGSGKGPSGQNGIGDQSKKQGWEGSFPLERGLLSNRSVSGQRSGAGPVGGYKPKDLMMVPFRVAMALQADGWWLRSVIPWLKRNSMPESVTDRPATAVEYIFLLSKSRTYYWDAGAVRRGISPTTNQNRGDGIGVKNAGIEMGSGSRNNRSFAAATSGAITSRNWRNSDMFFDTMQGLILDEQDDPLALVVNPAPFKNAHYATFPPKLIEPMVKASTRPGDVILDPFGGAGTVGLVADRLQRDAVLCELSGTYSPMAASRITSDAPLFAQVDSL